MKPAPNSLPRGYISALAMTQTWRTQKLEMYAIYMLAIIEDDTQDLTSPIWRIPLSMLQMTNALRLMASIFPHIDYFAEDLFRVNDALRVARSPQRLLFGRRSTFGNPSYKLFAEAPFKVLYITQPLDTDFGSTLESWAIKPIVVSSISSDIVKFRKIGCTAYDLAGFNRSSFCEAMLAHLQFLRGNLSLLSAEQGRALDRVNENSSWSRFHTSAFNPVTTTLNSLAYPVACLLASYLRAEIVESECLAESEDFDAALGGTKKIRLLEKASELIIAYGHRGLEPLPALKVPYIALIADQSNRNLEAFLSSIEATLGCPQSREGLILYQPCIDEASLQIHGLEKLNEREKTALFRVPQSHAQSRLEQLPEAERIRSRNWLFTIEESERFMRASVSLLSLTELTPAICLPRLSSAYFRKFRAVRDAYRQGRYRLGREIGLFGSMLRAAVDDRLIPLLRGLQFIRLVTDLPLEWMLVDGVPLTFRMRVSRIPVTPGNKMLLHLATADSEFLLTAVNARRTLVINCLKKTDPIFSDGYSVRAAT